MEYKFGVIIDVSASLPSLKEIIDPFDNMVVSLTHISSTWVNIFTAVSKEVLSEQEIEHLRVWIENSFRKKNPGWKIDVTKI